MPRHKDMAWRGRAPCRSKAAVALKQGLRKAALTSSNGQPPVYKLSSDGYRPVGPGPGQ